MRRLISQKSYFESGGKRYRVTPYYNRVLTFLRACDDQELSLNNLCDIAGRLFLSAFGRARLKRLDSASRQNWLTDFITNVVQTKKEDEQTASKEDAEPVFDFWIDADYIYAAFFQTYRLDLHAEVNHLYWRDFMALLSGLPKNTRLSDIMDIRSQEIPEKTDYNAKEIQKLEDAKDFFALHKRVKKDNYKEGLCKLFGELKAWAQS
jgi:hypothetical protein